MSRVVTSLPSQARARKLTIILFIACAYYLAGTIGLRFASVHGFERIVWSLARYGELLARNTTR